MKKVMSAGIAGLLFGLGLTLSGMLDPARVLGFLDLAGGAWDPTLVFVLAAALGVSAIGYGLVTKRSGPVYGDRFDRFCRHFRGDLLPRHGWRHADSTFAAGKESDLRAMT